MVETFSHLTHPTLHDIKSSHCSSHHLIECRVQVVCLWFRVRYTTLHNNIKKTLCMFSIHTFMIFLHTIFMISCRQIMCRNSFVITIVVLIKNTSLEKYLWVLAGQASFNRTLQELIFIFLNTMTRENKTIGTLIDDMHRRLLNILYGCNHNKIYTVECIRIEHLCVSTYVY